ncbi:MAG: hypothetical protein NXI04_18920 [Planctomycetaceae bacterium]|nr:hypothetical protein [Planctomycetaceae bacterium]
MSSPNGKDGIIEERSYTLEQINVLLGWSEKYVSQLELLFGLERFGSAKKQYSGRDLISSSKRQKKADWSEQQTKAAIAQKRREERQEEAFMKALEKLDV